MRWGFTGTRNEPSTKQRAWIEKKVRESEGDNSWHHGACVGSDRFLHLAVMYGTFDNVFLHPPINQNLAMALDKLHRLDRVLIFPAKDYHTRNRDIVNDTDELLATPDGPFRPHSGTWYTIVYALKQGKPVTICMPDGTIIKPKTMADLPR